jgi:hypothetical protein
MSKVKLAGTWEESARSRRSLIFSPESPICHPWLSVPTGGALPPGGCGLERQREAALGICPDMKMSRGGDKPKPKSHLGLGGGGKLPRVAQSKQEGRPGHLQAPGQQLDNPCTSSTRAGRTLSQMTQGQKGDAPQGSGRQFLRQASPPPHSGDCLPHLPSSLWPEPQTQSHGVLMTSAVIVSPAFVNVTRAGYSDWLSGVRDPGFKSRFFH